MSIKCLSWCPGEGASGVFIAMPVAWQSARTGEHGLETLSQAGGMDAALGRARSRMHSVRLGPVSSPGMVRETECNDLMDLVPRRGCERVYLCEHSSHPLARPDREVRAGELAMDGSVSTERLKSNVGAQERAWSVL